jgi:hypothetical protein
MLDYLPDFRTAPFYLGIHVRSDAVAKSLLHLSLIELMHFSLVNKEAKSFADKAFVKLTKIWGGSRDGIETARRRIERLFFQITLLEIWVQEPPSDNNSTKALNNQLRRTALIELPRFVSNPELIIYKQKHPFLDLSGEYITNKETFLYRALCHFILKKRIDLVQYLLKCGADPNYEVKQNFYRRKEDIAPPLHLAAGLGDLKCVELLIQHGAKSFLFKTYEQDFTPLDFALGETKNPFYNKPYYRPHIPVMKLLLENGALAEGIPSPRTFYPLWTALVRGSREAMELLIEHGVPMNQEVAIDVLEEGIRFIDCTCTNALECLAFLVEKGAPGSMIDWLDEYFKDLIEHPENEDLPKAHSLIEFLRSKGAK